MSQSRRLAAILAADLAGYSRLIGIDEQGTLNRLRSIRTEVVEPKINEHYGRLVKTTGDGLLVEFGSVVDALRCATEIQREMAARKAQAPVDTCIEFRIGINVGDIVVEDGDIFGDGVNVAARLEGLAEPGGICVSARVQEDAAGKLDLTFEDIGEQALKNIARPIRVYRVHVPVGETAPTASAIQGRQSLSLPDKPSIAVLPFQNMSGDPEQEYFVDGMVEEIITALSRIRWLFVIARNSSFTYKGRAVDVKQVGRELGVRYILEGSVRQAGNRVRITGQLIDTTTGTNIWADRFDGALNDVFELQDQIASTVAGAIEPKLRLAEFQRASRKPTESLDAYDLYLRAMFLRQQYSLDSIRAAIVLAERAIEIDPDYAPALAMIGWCRVHLRAHGLATVSDAEIDHSLRLARRSIEIGKEDPDALWMAAHVLAFLGGEHETAASVVARALALNPNSAHAWMVSGIISNFRDRGDAAIEALQRALRLSPVDPIRRAFSTGLAVAHMMAGRYEQAIEWAEAALGEEPTYRIAIRIKVVCSAYLGRSDETRAWLQRLLQIEPGLTLKRYKAANTFLPPHILDFFERGLGIAGLPER